MEINYFGKPYSFTHLAALKRFGKNHKYFSRSTIEETVKSLEKDSIAVVPIENTYGGIIGETVNLMTKRKNNIQILEELEMQIKLYLLSKSSVRLNTLKKIYSHEYPLKISKLWISQNLPQAMLEKVASTSDACILAKKEEYSCAIASLEAANHYNLEKLNEIRIDGKDNLTKFFILKKN